MKTPKDIKEYLDRYIIGQHEAKKALSVAAYNHYKRITLGGKLKKSNVLMIGPTGTGKTYMVSILAEMLDVKFLAVDATQFTAAGYVGRDVDDIIRELYDICQKNENEVSNAIIFIDEIDKIRKKTSSDGSSDIGGVEVQQSLLKLLEGTQIAFASSGSKIDPPDTKVNTKNIMFVCSGAFVNLQTQDTDGLVKFGMIPEFLGRFAVTTYLKPLSAEDLKKILTDAEGSILDSAKEWFDSEGIEFIAEDSGLDAIVELAIKKNLGARGLNGVLDEVLLNAQFLAPSMLIKPKRFILDADVVRTGIPKWRYS